MGFRFTLIKLLHSHMQQVICTIKQKEQYTNCNIGGLCLCFTGLAKIYFTYLLACLLTYLLTYLLTHLLSCAGYSLRD
jgi:hypothetical protein